MISDEVKRLVVEVLIDLGIVTRSDTIDKVNFDNNERREHLKASYDIVFAETL